MPPSFEQMVRDWQEQSPPLNRTNDAKGSTNWLLLFTLFRPDCIATAKLCGHGVIRGQSFLKSLPIA
jgi:hypothetical protein